MSSVDFAELLKARRAQVLRGASMDEDDEKRTGSVETFQETTQKAPDLLHLNGDSESLKSTENGVTASAAAATEDLLSLSVKSPPPPQEEERATPVEEPAVEDLLDFGGTVEEVVETKKEESVLHVVQETITANTTATTTHLTRVERVSNGDTHACSTGSSTMTTPMNHHTPPDEPTLPKVAKPPKLLAHLGIPTEPEAPVVNQETTPTAAAAAGSNATATTTPEEDANTLDEVTFKDEAPIAPETVWDKPNAISEPNTVVEPTAATLDEVTLKDDEVESSSAPETILDKPNAISEPTLTAEPSPPAAAQPTVPPKVTVAPPTVAPPERREPTVDLPKLPTPAAPPPQKEQPAVHTSEPPATREMPGSVLFAAAAGILPFNKKKPVSQPATTTAAPPPPPEPTPAAPPSWLDALSAPATSDMPLMRPALSVSAAPKPATTNEKDSDFLWMPPSDAKEPKANGSEVPPPPPQQQEEPQEEMEDFVGVRTKESEPVAILDMSSSLMTSSSLLEEETRVEPVVPREEPPSDAAAEEQTDAHNEEDLKETKPSTPEKDDADRSPTEPATETVESETTSQPESPKVTVPPPTNESIPTSNDSQQVGDPLPVVPSPLVNQEPAKEEPPVSPPTAPPVDEPVADHSPPKTEEESPTTKAAASNVPPPRAPVPPSPSEMATPHATVVKLPPLPPTPEIRERKDSSSEKDVLLIELQSSLQDHMSKQAEAENQARRSEEKVQHLQEQLAQKEGIEAELQALKISTASLASEKSSLEMELEKLREARDEHERKEVVLSNRLNAAKKKEAAKANAAEQLEEELKQTTALLEETNSKLAETLSSKNASEEEAQETQQDLSKRLKETEALLADERRLNDERKKKMKSFIETKQEELRQTKSQSAELNQELEQSNRLLREHNSRWKQLHAQWVQSQTRNRELQRDLNKIKKDSDNLHKMGDKMNMKMAQSAQETEEHKTKRLTAKHELMTLLRTLEVEREVSSRLRDSIKFTFTPKALSQQQLLKESLQDFESELQKMSRRLGRPLPPSDEPIDLFSLDDSTASGSENATTETEEGNDEDEAANGERNEASRRNRSEEQLLSNLENETQRVSKCIMALTSSIERMHAVLDESGDRTCITALHDLFGGAPAHNAAASPDESTSTSRLTSLRSRRYGQLPTNAS